MNILVTNDDGFDNPGIWALVRAVKDLGDATVVAPANNQSGVGTALSLRRSVHINSAPSKVDGVSCYAVGGTPADSVIIGIEHVLLGEVDLVVSGVNPGFNTSRNVFISGTMGAAIQAAGKGVTASAFSMGLGGDLEDPMASKMITTVTTELLSEETPTGSLFNVNFPDTAGSEYLGAEGAFPQPTEFMSKLEAHSDGGYEIFSGLRINILGDTPTPGSDIEVLSRNKVAISALDGMTMVHQPQNPTLGRILASVNGVVG